MSNRARNVQLLIGLGVGFFVVADIKTHLPILGMEELPDTFQSPRQINRVAQIQVCLLLERAGAVYVSVCSAEYLKDFRRVRFIPHSQYHYLSVG